MHWTLWVVWSVGCSWWFGGESGGMPRFEMEGLQAELAEHEGEIVEVSGMYRALSAGDEILRVILIERPGEKQGLNCFTNHGVPFQGIAPNEPIVVRGRVEEQRGSYGLVACERVRD